MTRGGLVLAVGGELPPGPRGASPAVADSWRLDDGRVRGFELHWRRFAAACAELGVRGADLTALRAAVLAALPRTGRWFPRLALPDAGAAAVALTLRPAPEPRSTARARPCPAPVPRARPTTKGPDLAALGALRAAAERLGADEALLVDAAGRLLEGAYSSLLWWEGETLWAVPDDGAILPGVTRALLLAAARAEGLVPRERRPWPEELEGREVWLTSALNGIRAVVPGGAGTLRAGPASRAPAWQARLEATARELPPVPGATGTA